MLDHWVTNTISHYISGTNYDRDFKFEEQEISQLPHFTTAAIYGHINTFINVNNCVTLLKVFITTLVLSTLINDHTKYMVAGQL